MAEIEKTPDLITGDDIGATVIDHTILADSFINVSASDPTVANDTGLGYVVGSLWVNSSSGEVFQAIDVTAESSVWVNQEGDDVNNDPYNGSNFGFSFGGYGPTGGGDLKTVIDKFALTSPHSMTDYGEITTAGYKFGRFTDAAKTKAFVCSGNVPPGDSPQEVCTFNFVAPISTTDIGDLLHTRTADPALQCQTPSLGILGGGTNYPGGSSNNLDLIQTFSNGTSPFTAADSGAELVTILRAAAASESPTHGYMAGGYIPAVSTNITRYQKGTSNNSTDVGELLNNQGASMAGATDGRGGKGFAISGTNTSYAEVDMIQSFPFASPTAGTDVGEWTITTGPAGRNFAASGGCSSITDFYCLDYTANLWKGAYASPSTTADVAEATTDHDSGGMTQY